MRYLTIAAALLVCILWTATADAQQVSFASLFDSAQINLDEHIGKIQKWESAARWSWIIVLFVGVLGIVTAALQAVTFKGKGLATALVGGLISGATVFSAATIPADYKTLDNLASNGTRLTNAAARWLEKGRAAATDPDRQFALDEIEKRLRALALLGIPDKPAADTSTAAQPFLLDGFVAVVHAAEPAAPQQCGCAFPWAKRQVGYDTIACGTGSGASLNEAHDRAVFEAAKNIAAQLKARMKTTLSDQQVAEYVRRVASEFDSCPVSGKKTEMAVLLRLPASLGREQAITAFASRSGMPARLTVKSIGVVQDGSTGDTGWVFDILVDGRLVTRVPARDYSDRAGTRLVSLSGRTAVDVPVDLPKGNYWLVEIKGKRTMADDTAIGAAAVSAVDRPVEIAVANPDPRNGSFVFTVAFAKER